MTDNTYKDLIELLENTPQLGWKCPACGTIWSPYQQMCPCSRHSVEAGISKGCVPVESTPVDNSNIYTWGGESYILYDGIKFRVVSW